MKLLPSPKESHRRPVCVSLPTRPSVRPSVVLRAPSPARYSIRRVRASVDV
jgi:hypothetical protein